MYLLALCNSVIQFSLTVSSTIYQMSTTKLSRSNHSNFLCFALFTSLFYKSVLYLHFDDNTHARLTALFPGLSRWAGTRKVKPIWILLKQETVSGSGISWAICKSAPHSRQITMPAPHHSVFYRPDSLPAAQPTASKHWRQNFDDKNQWKKRKNIKKIWLHKLEGPVVLHAQSTKCRNWYNTVNNFDDKNQWKIYVRLGQAIMEELDKGCSECCATVGTATRTAGMLIHSQVKSHWLLIWAGHLADSSCMLA